MSTVATRISIRPLHPLFVAEITGVDLTVPVAREDFRAIWNAFNEHQILVFRDQPFEDESQIAFSRKFGALETMEIPFVCLQRRPFGVTANFAGWDDVGSGIVATTHLMEIGCQRIAYIGDSNSKIAGDRHAGYLQALARQGSIPPDEYVVDGDCGNSSWQAFGFKAMLRLLQLDPRPDSIFCWNDPVALGAIRAIEGAGLRIPKDIAIVGCGNSHSDSWSSVPLSSIDQNSQRLGASAAMLALRLMDQPAMVPQSLIVPAQLIVRASSQR